MQIQPHNNFFGGLIKLFPQSTIYRKTNINGQYREHFKRSKLTG